MQQSHFLSWYALLALVVLVGCQPEPVWTDNCVTANSTSGTCITCIQGFYLEYFLCLPCAPLCTCTSQYNYCQSCIQVSYNNTNYNVTPYFQLQANRCYFCNEWMPYCLACTSQTNCTECFGGYYPVVVNNTTASCSQKCQGNFCDLCINSTSCKICSPGYFLDKTTLICSNVTCGSNCIECSSPSICKNCTINYYLNTTTNICEFCNITACSICFNASYCNNCTPGYYASNGSCVSTGFSNCVVYIGGAQSATGCQICQPGYFVLYSSCFQCVGCELCSLQFLCQSKCFANATPFNFACLVPVTLAGNQVLTIAISLLTLILMAI